MARLQSLRDTPNTAREYETIYILRPNTPNEGVAEVNTRIKNVIEGMGGKVMKVDNWGKRRLAYEIKKQREGTYAVLEVSAEPAMVKEFERQIRLNENVVRFMSTRIPVRKRARPAKTPDVVEEVV